MPYPMWICSECGERYGNRIPTCATWHEGDDCGWCGSAAVPVTEPRDFGYPDMPGAPVTRSATEEVIHKLRSEGVPMATIREGLKIAAAKVARDIAKGAA